VGQAVRVDSERGRHSQKLAKVNSVCDTLH
jgi:hypothetical protein